MKPEGNRNRIQEAKESTLRAIERRSGVRVETLAPDNVEPFLRTMQEELSLLTVSWKAQFVTQAVRKLIDKTRGPPETSFTRGASSAPAGAPRAGNP
jgi:hypothetical protein